MAKLAKPASLANFLHALYRQRLSNIWSCSNRCVSSDGITERINENEADLKDAIQPLEYKAVLAMLQRCRDKFEDR